MKELKNIETKYWRRRQKNGIKRDAEIIESFLKKNTDIDIVYSEKLNVYHCGSVAGCAALFSIVPKTELIGVDELNSLLKKTIPENITPTGIREFAINSEFEGLESLEYGSWSYWQNIRKNWDELTSVSLFPNKKIIIDAERGIISGSGMFFSDTPSYFKEVPEIYKLKEADYHAGKTDSKASC